MDEHNWVTTEDHDGWRVVKRGDGDLTVEVKGNVATLYTTKELAQMSADMWAKRLEIVKSGEPYHHKTSCPLCKRFCDEYSYCGECPIKMDSGEDGCIGTPWARADSQLEYASQGLRSSDDCEFVDVKEFVDYLNMIASEVKEDD